MTRSTAVFLLALPLAAQPSQQRFSETREYPVAAAARVTVDARPNGGISIRGWERTDILVRATVQTHAPSLAEAQSMARQIHVVIEGAGVRTDMPDFGSGRTGSVSYEVFLPVRTGLVLRANNGGISLTGVTGEIDFETRNGGVSLDAVGGKVSGTTRNGGISIELAGAQFDGEELDVSTRNGGMSIEVPAGYSALLETGTVNGRLHIEHPAAQVVGDNRRATITFGSGGARLRAYTTNGAVQVKVSRPAER